MPLSSAELQTLKTELAKQVYAGKDDVECARLLNANTASVDDTDEKPLWQLLALMDPVELAAVEADAVRRERLRTIMSCQTLNPNALRLRAQFATVFPNGTTTFSRFNQWQRRSGSQAEALGLPRITESDIADARRA